MSGIRCTRTRHPLRRRCPASTTATYAPGATWCVSRWPGRNGWTYGSGPSRRCSPRSGHSSRPRRGCVRPVTTSDDPSYQIHDWIDGVVLDRSAPRGTRIPAGVITQCVTMFEALSHVPVRSLPALPPDWPRDGDCAGFAERLLGVTRKVRARFAERYGELWRSLEIPADPFEPLALHGLHPRPFRLIHCDVHRKNIILEPATADTPDPVCRF